MSPILRFFLSPLAGSREGKRGRDYPTAGPAPTQSLVPGPVSADESFVGDAIAAQVVGHPEPGDQDNCPKCRRA